MRVKANKLIDYPNGTLLKRFSMVYVLMYGLEGRIVTNVDSGTWKFVTEIDNWSFRLLHQPAPSM